MHTNGGPGLDDPNHTIKVQFEAVMLDPKTENIWLKDGHKYYITAGVEFGSGAYIWIGQKEVQTILLSHDYDVNVAFKDTPAATIPKGSGTMVEIDVTNTNPFADFEVHAFQHLGFTDVFSVGQMVIDFGNAFACRKDDIWEKTFYPSPTGVSYNKVVYKYPYMINRASERDETDTANDIKIKIPIHALDIESVVTGLSRRMSFSVKVGGDTLWTGQHDFEIADKDSPSPQQFTVSAVKATVVFKFCFFIYVLNLSSRILLLLCTTTSLGRTGSRRGTASCSE